MCTISQKVQSCVTGQDKLRRENISYAEEFVVLDNHTIRDDGEKTPMHVIT